MDIKNLTELLIEKGYELTFGPEPLDQRLIELVLVDPISCKRMSVMVDVTTHGMYYDDVIWETAKEMVESMDTYRRCANVNRVVWEGWKVKDFINYIEPSADQIMCGCALRKGFTIYPIFYRFLHNF